MRPVVLVKRASSVFGSHICGASFMHNAGNSDRVNMWLSLDPGVTSLIPVVNIIKISARHSFNRLVSCFVHDVPKAAIFWAESELQCDIAGWISAFVEFEKVFFVVLCEFTKACANWSWSIRL